MLKENVDFNDILKCVITSIYPSRQKLYNIKLYT
jgi:uncharacterized protein YqfB (UPF0267 family)